MKKKTLATILLSAIMAICFGFGVFTVATGEVINAKADVTRYEINEVAMHAQSKVDRERALYIQFFTEVGVPADTGYNAWVAPDEYTSAFRAQLLVNGEPATESILLQGMDTTNALCMTGHTYGEGFSIVIPKGATFQNEKVSFEFMTNFMITWSKTAGDFVVTKTDGELDIPEFIGKEETPEEEEFKTFEVDSVSVHPHSKVDREKNIFIQFSTADGQKALTGYTGWDAMDDYLKDFRAQISINGYQGDESVTITGMNVDNAFCISGYYFSEDFEIVIPDGTVFENTKVRLTFVREFVITWDAEIEDFKVERTFKEIIVPDYEMPEGMLSDFTQNAAVRLVDQSFMEAAVNNPGNGWGGDYQSYKIAGAYLDEDESPEGSTNGTYQMSWESLATLYYPCIMFYFPQDVSFGDQHELVFRMYLSEGIDLGFTFWITSALTPNIWDAQTKLLGSSLKAGEWNEIRVNPMDYADENGKIAPIAFTFYYPTTLAVTPAAQVYFDTVTFEEVERVLADEYTTKDISEIIPVGDGMDFVGEADGSDEFDFSKEQNVKFVRKDMELESVKMMLTINDLSNFEIYFVMNGTGLYYNNGGVYFWLSELGYNMGYSGKNFEREELPASVVAGKPFEFEIRNIKYYVNGLESGYFAQAFINGEEIGENGYIPSSMCNFGKHFAFYMHTTTPDVTVNIAPVEKSTKAPISITLNTRYDTTEIGADDYVKLESKVIGTFHNQSEVTYEIISGGEYSYIDEEGYLNGIKDGVTVIVAKVTNSFGTFTSNELTIKIGEGLPESKPSAPASRGCKNSASGVATLTALALVAVEIIRKKNK